MDNVMKFGIIILSFVFFILITHIQKKGRMPIKYALVWYCADLVVLLTGVLPGLMGLISSFFGFKVLSNMILVILIIILIFISIILTIIVAGQTTKIRILIQEVSLLKEKVEKENNK